MRSSSCLAIADDSVVYQTLKVISIFTSSLDELFHQPKMEREI